MKFRVLAEICENLASVSEHVKKTDIAADFLRQLQTSEIQASVLMMIGKSFPEWDQKVLDISWTTLTKVVRSITGASSTDFSGAFRQTGDIGSAAQIILDKSNSMRQRTLYDTPLTILEVRNIFETIAESRGHRSKRKKERLIRNLIERSNSLESKYLLRIMIGEMRTGFHEGLMKAAISKAFDVSLESVRKATMLTGDIGEVAAVSRRSGEEGVSKLGPKVLRPIKPMAAQQASNLKEALEKHGGKTAFEYKLDGARIQAHKLGDMIKIFSRRLTDTTESLPEIAKVIREEIQAKEAILEGEAVALDQNSRALPFQYLMRRFRRVYDINKTRKEIPVKLYLFDIIYVDGKSLVDLPYLERRGILKDKSGKISLTKQLITGDYEEANILLEEAISKGHEGLMAKRLDSSYTPGTRGSSWLKIKKTLEPLDLVIVAAQYGSGRRHHWLSDYHLAARDEDTGRFLTLGKTFKGLTDQEMKEMTKRLKEISIENQGFVIAVNPKIVVEVIYDEIQKSSKYRSGMALRFARIRRIRYDKNPNEADTIQRVRKIYKRQFEKTVQSL